MKLVGSWWVVSNCSNRSVVELAPSRILHSFGGSAEDKRTKVYNFVLTFGTQAFIFGATDLETTLEQWLMH